MGQQVQESQIANYQRRMQREAPACCLRSLFEQNHVFRQLFTVTVSDGAHVAPGEPLHAMLIVGDGPARFVVTNREARQVGVISGESGRVLAETLHENRLTTVPLIVNGIVPICGDAQVQIVPE